MAEWRKHDWLPVLELDGEYGSAMARWRKGMWDAVLRVPGEYERQMWGMKVDLNITGEPTGGEPATGKVVFTSVETAKRAAELGLEKYEDAVRRGLSYEHVYPPPSDPDAHDVGWSSDHVRHNLGVWR